MTERSITQMFPKPVFKMSQPEAEWHNENILEEISKLEFVKNYGNVISKNNYILNEPQFKPLRDAIQEELNLVISEYYERPEIQLYITQSWFNINEDDDHHPSHCHSNSFMSGSMYLQTGFDDAIMFSDPSINFRINILPNSKYPEVRLPVTKGDIILFDSLIYHSVEKVKRKTKRISLAFNTWFKGTVGNPNLLTELRL